MTREEKSNIIDILKKDFSTYSTFYVTDSLGLNVDQVNKLRKTCHEKGVVYKVAKNTLILKALEENKETYGSLIDELKGPTSLFFSSVSNLPAKIIKDFRKSNDKPVLKIAYVNKEFYQGDDQLDILAKLKSKEELISDVIGLLQSPILRVIQGLKSGSSTLSGLVKTLADSADKEADAADEKTDSADKPAEAKDIKEETPEAASDPNTKADTGDQTTDDKAADASDKSADTGDDNADAPSETTDSEGNNAGSGDQSSEDKETSGEPTDSTDTKEDTPGEAGDNPKEEEKPSGDDSADAPEDSKDKKESDTDESGDNKDEDK